MSNIYTDCSFSEALKYFNFSSDKGNSESAHDYANMIYKC